MRISSFVYCTLFIMVNSRKIQRRPKGKLRGIEFAKKRITNARGIGSCIGERACDSSDANIGDGSCVGQVACIIITGSNIGNYSCIGNYACEYFFGDIGDNSCRGEGSCDFANATIGSNSCITDYSCADYRGNIPSNCPSVAAMDAGDCNPEMHSGGNETVATVDNETVATVDLYTVGMNVCQGDCDEDDDCNEGLVCYFRNGMTPIPGCLGVGTADYDYCVDFGSIPSYANLTTVGKNPTHTLGQCQGDCDHDDDCAGILVCHQRDGMSEIPGCQGSGVTNYDYCTSA